MKRISRALTVCTIITLVTGLALLYTYLSNKMAQRTVIKMPFSDASEIRVSGIDRLPLYLSVKNTSPVSVSKSEIQFIGLVAILEGARFQEKTGKSPLDKHWRNACILMIEGEGKVRWALFVGPSGFATLETSQQATPIQLRGDVELLNLLAEWVKETKFGEEKVGVR